MIYVSPVVVHIPPLKLLSTAAAQHHAHDKIKLLNSGNDDTASLNDEKNEKPGIWASTTIYYAL